MLNTRDFTIPTGTYTRTCFDWPFSVLFYAIMDFVVFVFFIHLLTILYIVFSAFMQQNRYIQQPTEHVCERESYKVVPYNRVECILIYMIDLTIEYIVHALQQSFSSPTLPLYLLIFLSISTLTYVYIALRHTNSNMYSFLLNCVFFFRFEFFLRLYSFTTAS